MYPTNTPPPTATAFKGSKHVQKVDDKGFLVSHHADFQKGREVACFTQASANSQLVSLAHKVVPKFTAFICWGSDLCGIWKRKQHKGAARTSQETSKMGDAWKQGDWGLVSLAELQRFTKGVLLRASEIVQNRPKEDRRVKKVTLPTGEVKKKYTVWQV